MNKIQRILAPIRDIQSRAPPAVEKAAQVASAMNAELELFHDIANPVWEQTLTTPSSLRRIKADGRRAVLDALERLAEPLRRRGLKVSTAAVWDCPPFEAIIRRAVAIGAQLIVAPRRDRHRLAGLLGYTDWELLRLSPVPILLVKTPASYRRPTVLAAVDPEHRFSKSSGLDRRILEEAEEITRALHGSLHVMNAYLPLPLPPPGMPLDSTIPARLLKAAHDEARKGFERALTKATVRPANRHLVKGDAADAIVSTARRTRCSIMVLGAVSRSGLSRLFIGNTAERVLDELDCDVLVVKPAKFLLKVRRARRGVQFMSAATYNVT